ncbi:hypothetical protein B0O99DRAFT_606985 [Bisporella sp. PMI_857]|nr:hypothetical protein B0O99DRAFT_606985 [Bisporella sp. PMI_857]
MSDSPSGLSNGRTPTPNGGPPQFVRKPKPKTDPLVARKKKPVRRENLPIQSRLAPNEPQMLRKPSPATSTAPRALPPQPPRMSGGWTQQPSGEFQDFPLVTTKQALLEGMRHHIARFASRKDIDPTDQDTFLRPISLHRRDPRQPVGKAAKEEELIQDVVVDSKEQERLDILKAEKEAQRAADLAQIAPSGKGPNAPASKKNQAFRNEKTSQVFRLDKTEAQNKESQLRYEEALPWHLEDSDYKNVWVGNYEAALSDTTVVFVAEHARFKMIPVEKWYKFTQKNQFEGSFTIEEAEEAFKKKHKESRWAKKQIQEKAQQEQQAQDRARYTKLFTVKAESATFKNATKTETQDADEVDFDLAEDFQDDDEQPGVVPDEDVTEKEAKERIKRDQLAANVFNQTNEADVDAEEQEDEEEAEANKRLKKEIRKALTKREKMTIYESDSSNPYASSSDDDTSDEEKQAEIDKRKDEEAKNKAKLESKLPSGASSKGTNTPSGRVKHVDPLRKSKNLKRSGSPTVSESSGNESTRKKKKIKHSSQPTGSNTPREITSTILNPNPPHGGSMSDGEATGGEMSDGGKRAKKIKIRLGGASTTSSRAGSPAPGRAGSIGAEGSRAGSPAIPNNTVRKTGPLQVQEIIDALGDEGVTLSDFIKKFPGRVGDDPVTQTSKKQFLQYVKDYAAYGSDKKLRRKKDGK